MYKTPSSELVELNEKPLNIVVAAGPFTFEVGFGYETFNELLTRMKEEKPDILILVRKSDLYNSFYAFVNDIY